MNCKGQIADCGFGALALAAAVFVLPVGVTAQKVDTKAAAAAIMQADREFNQSVASRDQKRFVSLISETAVFVGTGPMRGHDEILKGWAPFSTRADRRCPGSRRAPKCWSAATLEFTIGSWIRRTKTPDGKTTEARGEYATTWQKQKDGSWKVVYDIGSTAP